MKSAPVEYHAPSTIEETVALLAELGEGAKVLAGRQSGYQGILSAIRVPAERAR
jgi:hypothetical protein